MKNILNYNTQAEFAAAEENDKYVTSVVPGVAYVKENGKIGYNGREYIARIGYYRYLDNLPYDTPVTFGVQMDDSYREFVEITSFTQSSLELVFAQDVIDYCIQKMEEIEPLDNCRYSGLFFLANKSIFDSEYMKTREFMEMCGGVSENTVRLHIKSESNHNRIVFSESVFDNPELDFEVDIECWK